MKRYKENKKQSILPIVACVAGLSLGILSACSGISQDKSYKGDGTMNEAAYEKSSKDDSLSGNAFGGAQVGRSYISEDSVVTKENELPSEDKEELPEGNVAQEGNNPSSDSFDDSEFINSEKDEKKIRTVSMEIETKEITEKAKNLREKVKALSGYVESEDFQDTDSYTAYKRMYFTLRIPKDKMDEFLTYVEGEGRLRSRSESLEDVRLQYHDAQTHKKSLEKEQERVLAMMDKAENLDQLLILENRLTEIRYELENYGTQILEYDNKIDFATLHLTLTEKENLNKGEQSFFDRFHTGLEKNLYGIKLFFEGLILFLLIYFPQILFFLGIALISIFFYKAKKNSFKANKGKTMDNKTEQKAEQRSEKTIEQKEESSLEKMIEQKEESSLE